MVSKCAEADIQEMWEAGLHPTVADIIRLNALALKRERCARPDDSIFYARRCAFLGHGDGQVVFREPCLGHEIWLDDIEETVDLGNPETALAVDAYICGVDVADLPCPTDRKAIREAVEAYLVRLKPFPRGQIAAAVIYCQLGLDPLRGELPAPRKDDDDQADGDQSFSVPLGVLRHGIAVGVGLTLKEALNTPRQAFEGMVNHCYAFAGNIDTKKRESRLEDDYLRTLDQITARLKGTADG